MGLEAKTIAIQNRNRYSGRLHVDSKTLEFRGAELKWAVELGPKVKATYADSLLKVTEGRKTIRFEIEKGGERWVDKILNPPNRMDKLGIKPGTTCWISKGFDRSLLSEIKERGGKSTRTIGKCDLAFFFIEATEALGELLTVCQTLPTDTNIWVVYPKGAKSITQSDVMSALKKIDFGPSKTASFAEGISSMRYRRKP